MSGELPSLTSSHDMAASSAGARAHGRGLARAVLTVSPSCTARERTRACALRAQPSLQLTLRAQPRATDSSSL